MARPTEFGEQTRTIGPHPSNAGDVLPLPAMPYLDVNGGACVLSAWRLSAEELEEVSRTGIVYVSVCIAENGIPPLFIAGIYPEANVAEKIDK